MKKTIIWLKNDLRLSDNGALSYACKSNSEVLFLYILDENPAIGSASKWFLYKALKSFKEDIKKRYNREETFRQSIILVFYLHIYISALYALSKFILNH